MKSRSSSKISQSSAIINQKTETAVKLTKIKTELNFAEGEGEELAIVQAEMNAITKVEESELGLNDGNGGATLPGFITKGDLPQNYLVQNYLVTQASSVAIDSPSTVQTGLIETKNPLLSSTSFPVTQSHENDQLEQRIEDSNNPGFPVITLNPFEQEYVTLSTPKNAERTKVCRSCLSCNANNGLQIAWDLTSIKV